ncbi:MAG: 3-octaprenyl-4-hydroxybenzoate carboxy-lyase, partial [bacterium]
MAEIHRQIFEKQGPAILFERVKGSPFQAVSNIYGTFEQTAFLFRHTLEKVKRVIELKKDPIQALRNPLHYSGAPLTALSALPMKSRFGAPVTWGTTTIDQLPLVKGWPMD